MVSFHVSVSSLAFCFSPEWTQTSWVSERWLPVFHSVSHALCCWGEFVASVCCFSFLHSGDFFTHFLFKWHLHSSCTDFPSSCKQLQSRGAQINPSEHSFPFLFPELCDSQSVGILITWVSHGLEVRTVSAAVAYFIWTVKQSHNNSAAEICHVSFSQHLQTFWHWGTKWWRVSDQSWNVEINVY